MNVVIFVLLLLGSGVYVGGQTDDPSTDQLFDQQADQLAQLEDTVNSLKDSINALTRQVMMQQLDEEEKMRSDGSSGVKRIRNTKKGTKSFHADSHTGRSILSAHDHSEFFDTVGMGEFSAVLNGVEFRTRHNDYKLRKPAPVGSGFDALEDIEFPPVPPSVLNKTTVEEQIVEMRRYFDAFHKSWNAKLREPDYRPYFKPVLCYLEGMWTLSDDTVDEPFDSERHGIDAKTWAGLTDKIRYTSYSGRKSQLENYSFLPMKIMYLRNGTTPVFAQWNYRIACQPVDSYLRPKNFVLMDDIGVRVAQNLTLEQLSQERAARFIVNSRWSTRTSDRYFYNGPIDQMMQQVPGREGAGAVLHDEAFGKAAYHITANPAVSEKLNQAYYYSEYKTSNKDASGSTRNIRGYTDGKVYMALTTDPKVAPLSVEQCADDENGQEVCTTYEQRWTYAIPLEVIFLTPLTNWNPLNLPFRGSHKTEEGKAVSKNGRNGALDPAKAYNGTNTRYFYQTPDAFYSDKVYDSGDPADTVLGVAGVLDNNGDMQLTRASGVHIFLPEIAGVGRVRQRYPIPPVYCEGSTTYKEVDALKQILMHQKSLQGLMVEHDAGALPPPLGSQEMCTGITLTPSEHQHYFYLTADDVMEGEAGHNVTVMTEQASGHTHNLVIGYTDVTDSWSILECDGMPQCWDGHSDTIEVTDD